MRLKNIILTELVNDQLKAQENIERAINGNDDINDVCKDIKKSLHELAILELMISKWQEIIPNNKLIGEHNDKKNNNG